MNPCASHAEPLGQALNYLHQLADENAYFLLGFTHIGIPLICVIFHRLFGDR